MVPWSWLHRLMVPVVMLNLWPVMQVKKQIWAIYRAAMARLHIQFLYFLQHQTQCTWELFQVMMTLERPTIALPEKGMISI